MVASYIARASVAVAVAVTLAAAPAAAKKRTTKAKMPVAALFLVATNKPSPRLYATLLNELTRTAGETKSIRVLYGKSLRRAIKDRPEKAISKCDSNVACIARLGQRARAEVVLYGRVSPEGRGINVQLLVVEVAAQSISDRMALTLTSVAKIENEVAARLDALYPMGAPGAGDSDEIPLDAILGDALATPASEPEAVAEAPVSGDELPLRLADKDATHEPATAASAAPEPAAEEPLLHLAPLPDRHEEKTTAEAPTLAVIPPAERASSGGAGVLTYVGIGVAGLGAAAVGAGGYFGLEATSTRDSIVYGSGGTTQLEAKRLEQDANDQAELATLLFAGGGGAMALGAVLIALDLWVLGDDAPETSLSVGVDNARAVVTWRF